MNPYLRRTWAFALAGSLAALSFALAPTWAGGSWSAPVNLSSSTTYTEDAALAVDSLGRVHVVWSEGGQILHRYSDGDGWTTAVTVAAGYSPAVATDTSGQVYMVFVNRFAEVDDVYFTSWKADTDWQLPVNVSEAVGTSSSPMLIVDGNVGLATVWSSRSGDVDLIYVATSTDGVLWSSWPIPNAWGTRPAAAMTASGQLAVAWQGSYDVVGSPLEIFFSQQTDDSWTLPVDVSISPEADSVLPSLAAGDEQLHLAWQEETSSGQAVYNSVLVGGNWSSPQKRSASSEAYAPCLIAKLGGVHMVWTTGARVQYVAQSGETGVWGLIEDVAVEQSGARDASLAVASHLHVVWLAQAVPDNDDAFYSLRELEPSPTLSATASVTPTVLPSPTASPPVTPTVLPSPTASPSVTQTPEELVTVYLPCIMAGGELVP